MRNLKTHFMANLIYCKWNVLLKHAYLTLAVVILQYEVQIVPQINMSITMYITNFYRNELRRNIKDLFHLLSLYDFIQIFYNINELYFFLLRNFCYWCEYSCLKPMSTTFSPEQYISRVVMHILYDIQI